MSLLAIENFLTFAEVVVAVQEGLPLGIDALELESVLVSHGVVLLYAHMEQCFQKALEIKCGRCTDAQVRTFALSVKGDKTGKLKLESVKETLKRFGIDHKNEFSPHLDALGVKDAWDSVVNQRAVVAHYGQPASLTLAELRGFYQGIRQVLGAICVALSLSEQETTTISALIIRPACFPAGN
jgi:hypothetical protein